MEYEEVFEYIGQMGTYQILLFFLLGLLAFFSCVQSLAINFLTGHQDHWCYVEDLAIFPYDVQKNLAIPVDEDGEYESCSMYDLDYHNMSNSEIQNWNWTLVGRDNVSTITCTSWVYDQSLFVSTVKSEFDLVCDNNWLNSLSSTIYMFGVLLAAFTSGMMSDKLGRWTTTIIGVWINFAVSVATTFVPGYPAFVVLRFLNGASSTFAYLGSFVILLEVLGSKYRVTVGVTFQIFFSFGYIIVAAISYAIRDFRWFSLAISIPAVCTLMFTWLVPESPMWLFSQGKEKKAEKVLQKIAVVNKKTFPPNILTRGEKKEVSEEEKGSMLDICGSSILRREICVLYFIWFTTSLVYYGLSFNAAAFGGVHMNTMLSGLIEIPANLLCLLCLEKAGRRIPNAVAFMVAGAFCLACVPIVIVDNTKTELLTALSTVGKGAITFAFSGIYLYSSEMFHTPVRHVALGSSSTFARIGSMISPFIGPSLSQFWEPMPSLIFGVLAFVAGFVCLLLPETKGKKLPENLQEAEDLGNFKKKKSDKSMSVKGGQDSSRPASSGDVVCTLTKFSAGGDSPTAYDNPAFESSHQF